MAGRSSICLRHEQGNNGVNSVMQSNCICLLLALVLLPSCCLGKCGKSFPARCHTSISQHSRHNMALSEKLECQRQAKEQDADNVMEREIAILKEAGILLDK